MGGVTRLNRLQVRVMLIWTHWCKNGDIDMSCRQRTQRPLLLVGCTDVTGVAHLRVLCV